MALQKKELELGELYDVKTSTRESNFGMSIEELEFGRASTFPKQGNPNTLPMTKSQFSIQTHSRASIYFGDVEEDDAGNAIPHMRQGLALHDATRDSEMHLGETTVGDVEPPRIVHFLNMLLFGNGKYVSIPIIWLSTQFLVLVYRNVMYVGSQPYCEDFKGNNLSHPNTAYSYFCGRMNAYYFTATALLYFVGQSSSMSFGWKLSKMGYASNVINGHCSNLATEAREQAIIMLNRIIAGITAFLTFVYVFYITRHLIPEQVSFQVTVLNLNSRAIPTMFIILDIVTLFIFYISTFYIAAMWIWVCWIKSKVNQGLAESVSVDSILDDSFISTFITIYGSNMRKSAYWSVNHTIRVAVSVPYAWYLTSVGRYVYVQFKEVNDEVAQGALFLFVVGMSFYVLTWISIAAGGVVNDLGYTWSARKVSALFYVNNDSLPAEENQRNKARFEMLRVDALIRMDVVRSTTGIMFAGVILSVQKAVAIGSVLLTLMQVSYK